MGSAAARLSPPDRSPSILILRERHVWPPSEVDVRIERSPTAQACCASVASVLKRYARLTVPSLSSNGAFDSCFVHVVPPSAVARLSPSCPTIHPRLSSTKWTP